MSGYDGKYISGGARTLTDNGFSSSGARRLPAGSVLFSSRAPIGYCAIAARELTTNQGFKSFIPHPSVQSDFLLYWLRSAKNLAEEYASGTTFVELSGAKAATLPVPIAPTAEQTRIVAALEPLLDGLEDSERELKIAKHKLALYRQSLLKSAVDGSLTAEWRANVSALEAGADLVARIWRESQSLLRVAKTPTIATANFNPDLPNLPESWAWSTLGALTSIQGGIQKQPSRAPLDNRFPYLRVANVARGRLNTAVVHEIELKGNEIERYRLLADDLLVVEGNGSLGEIGRCARWDGSIADAVHQNHLIRARPLLMRGAFLEAWINSPWGVAQLTQLAATTSGLYTLSVGKLARLPVPVPSLLEQDVIVDVLVVQAEGVITQSKVVDHSLAMAAAQRQNILRAAFSGRLVPQDPNDEPASVLLDRIRASREASAVAKPRARGRTAARLAG